MDYEVTTVTDISEPDRRRTGKKSCLFTGCSKEISEDTYIFRQGDVPLKLYFILEGMVELGSINLNGKITRSSYVMVGEEFGEVRNVSAPVCLLRLCKSKK